MRTKVIAGVVVLALVATAIGAVSARNNLGMQPSTKAPQWSEGPCGMSKLTDEERQEIQQQMEEFRQELAEQYGIDLTDEERQEMQEQLREKQKELHQEMQDFRQELAEQYGIDLTDEERQEMQEQMQEFRQELFEQYGIASPAGSQFAGKGDHGPRGPIGRQMLGFQRGPGFGECPSIPPDLEE